MLRNRPVVLKEATAICKFHDFVFADAASRLHHINALEIDVARDGIDPSTCGEPAYDSLLAILRGASSLRSLVLWSLNYPYGRLLAYIGDPRIAAAVSALTTLRELTVIIGSSSESSPMLACSSP
ncbi:hypothetical protein LXA43DRAFT_1018435 [Ganoderma leucocontextum]|nr:hypothetical protein LXA43DRAFT_1018435 [Ganoderma leucocontextum]